MEGQSPFARFSSRTQPIQLIRRSPPPKFASTKPNRFSASAKGKRAGLRFSETGPPFFPALNANFLGAADRSVNACDLSRAGCAVTLLRTFISFMPVHGNGCQ